MPRSGKKKQPKPPPPNIPGMGGGETQLEAQGAQQQQQQGPPQGAAGHQQQQQQKAQGPQYQRGGQHQGSQRGSQQQQRGGGRYQGPQRGGHQQGPLPGASGPQHQRGGTHQSPQRGSHQQQRGVRHQGPQRGGQRPHPHPQKEPSTGGPWGQQPQPIWTGTHPQQPEHQQPQPIWTGARPKQPEHQQPQRGEPKSDTSRPESVASTATTATSSSDYQKFTFSTSSLGNVSREYQPPRAENQKQRQALSGKEGKRIKVFVNHYPLEIKCGDVYHYDVAYKFPFKKQLRKSDKPLCLRAVEKFKVKYQNELGVNPEHIVSDGLSSLYTAKKLKFPGKSFAGTVSIREMEDLDKEIELKIKFEETEDNFVIPVSSEMVRYCEEGSTASKMDSLSKPIQILNTVLGMSAQLKRVTIGRSIFTPEVKGTVVDIGNGKAMWKGIFLSVRPGWKPFVNVDMANKPGYNESSVEEFIIQMKTDFRGMRPNVMDILTKSYAREEVEKELKGTFSHHYAVKLRYNELSLGKIESLSFETTYVCITKFVFFFKDSKYGLNVRTEPHATTDLISLSGRLDRP